MTTGVSMGGLIFARILALRMSFVPGSFVGWLVIGVWRASRMMSHAEIVRLVSRVGSGELEGGLSF